jgi:uncharacterized protein (DUF924 family)
MNENDVLHFWFEELKENDWFDKNPALDMKIKERFSELYFQAVRGELFTWRKTIQGRLGEIILLDQISRNMFRDTANSFQYDFLALVLSQEASLHKDLNELTPTQKGFLFLPFMHSESLKVHQQAVALFSEPGLEYNLKYLLQHTAIIKQFGRYPHRNKILGRISTDEEIEFLKKPNSSF